MSVPSTSSLSTPPAGFEKDTIVFGPDGKRYSILFVNDDGTMAVKPHGFGENKWRVPCTDYTLPKPKAVTSTWPLPEPAAPKGPASTRRLKGGLGD